MPRHSKAGKAKAALLRQTTARQKGNVPASWTRSRRPSHSRITSKNRRGPRTNVFVLRSRTQLSVSPLRLQLRRACREILHCWVFLPPSVVPQNPHVTLTHYGEPVFGVSGHRTASNLSQMSSSSSDTSGCRWLNSLRTNFENLAKLLLPLSVSHSARKIVWPFRSTRNSIRIAPSLCIP